MNTSCDVYQMRFMDAHYGERELTRKEQEHLEHCEACAAFWETLQHVDQALEPVKMAASSELTQVLPADIVDIRRAFNKVEAQRESERSTYQFLTFLSVAIMIVMAMTVPVLIGRADVFVTMQGILALIAFLSIPIIIKSSGKKGNQHGT